MTAETQESKVLNEKRHVTQNVTGLVRYIAFGITAACFAIFSSSSEFSVAIISTRQNTLLLAAILAVLTIFFDYLQFVAATCSVNKALENKDGNFLYDDEWLSYKVREIFFVLKQILLIGSVLFFLYSLYSML